MIVVLEAFAPFSNLWSLVVTGMLAPVAGILETVVDFKSSESGHVSRVRFVTGIVPRTVMIRR